MSQGASRIPLDWLSVSATEVLRRVRHRRRLVALTGEWAQGEALITFDPDRELGPDEDPFAVGDQPPTSSDGTFGGGWLGAWGYRLGRRLETIDPEPPRPLPQPDHVLAHYRHVLRRVQGKWWAESLGSTRDLEAWLDHIRPDLATPSTTKPYGFSPFRSTPGPDAHEAAVAQVLERIFAGDIYQANICQRLEARFTGDPLDVFCAGIEELAPAYAAYVSWDGGAVVSLSPELFLRRDGNDVLTSPIKGTAPLAASPATLTTSAKDRAENIMIVDLMRNDLSRVCEPGSVRVPALTRLERHSVWHLVSDVTGRLREGLTDADLLRATFPPGSVTGAPKVAAMNVIAGLEATAREFYTGAIGYISPHTGMELNVAIRTLEFALDRNSGGRAWLGVGGGIVAESKPALEQTECLTKALPILSSVGAQLSTDAPAVFETLLVIDGQPVDPAPHLARLAASVESLYEASLPAGLDLDLTAAAAGHTGPSRLRIDAVPSSAGVVDVSITVSPLVPEPPVWELDVLCVPGGLGPHKWADRTVLGTHSPGRDRLVVDVDGAVLETGRGSLFIVLGDEVWTPPLDGRILPGTQRARVIKELTDRGIPVRETALTLDDLKQASEVFATNALRSVVPITACRGLHAWPPGHRETVASNRGTCGAG